MSVQDIAVIIPAFNASAWIEEAVGSVLAQEPRPTEVVVVDDGSTDGTPTVLKRFTGDIRVVTQQNRGPGAARNVGAEKSSARWIFFLDADDRLLPGALHRIGAFLETRPETSVLSPRFRSFPDGSDPMGRGTYTRDDLSRVIWRNPFAGNAVIRREVWQRVRFPEDLRACEDLLLWCSLLLEGYTIDRSPDVLFERRRGHTDAITGDVMRLRRCRREVFSRLRRRTDLTFVERRVLEVAIGKTTVGIWSGAR